MISSSFRLDSIMTMLDQHQPTWAFDWAMQEDLRTYAFHLQAGHPAMEYLRDRIAQRLFHRIVNAALEAGVVALPQ